MRNRQQTRGPRKPPTPLSAPALEELALSYAARYATSAAKLEQYLARKLRERGWDDDGEPPVRAVVARMVEARYVDDAAFARARSGDLLRRGYGARRVDQALGQAGIAAPVRQEVAPGEATRRRAALRLAERRGFGPFAADPIERPMREKQIAAMLRAGHSFDHVRALFDAEGEDAARQWAAEAEDADDDEFD